MKTNFNPAHLFGLKPENGDSCRGFLKEFLNRRFRVKLSSFVLPALLLWAAPTARANFSGSDRLESETNWTSMPQPGNGQLLFQNNRAEYVLGTTTVRDNLDVHYWKVNTGSYTSDWSVQVDVHLALLSLPTDGDAANLNLVITPNTQGSNGSSFSAAIDRYVVSDGGGGLNYMADFGTFLDSAGVVEVADSATDATLKINFDSTQKTFTAYYNKGTGWIQIGQPVSIAGWNMGSDDTFSVALVSNSGNFQLRDTAAAVASGEAYYKNFVIATVLNGDFETGASAPWTSAMQPDVPVPTVAAAHSGQYGLEVTGMGPPALISQQIQTHLTAGTVYRFTGWINLLEVNPDIPLQMPRYFPHLGIYLGNSFSAAVVANAINAVGQGWQKLEVFRSFTAAELQSGVTLEVGGLAKFQMDDVSATSEVLANQSFDTPAGAGWSYEPLGVWAPFAVAGEVNLHRSWTPDSPPVKMLWQDLDISNVGGLTATASMRLILGDAARFTTPGTASTTVYLDYLDGAGTPQRSIILNPDNTTVGYGPDGSFFTANFTIPAHAQKVTGFSVDRTYGGPFRATEFRLGIMAAAAVVPPGVSISSPIAADSFASGTTIPLVAEVDTSGGTAVTGVDFYDNGSFIGQAQLNFLGGWVFPDTSELFVMGNSGGGMVDYSPPGAYSGGEQMYSMDGTFPTSDSFQGTYSHWDETLGDIIYGNATIQFSLSSNGTLDASMLGDAPLGTRNLTGGVSQAPQYKHYTFSWSGAAVGPHSLTARAYYQTGNLTTYSESTSVAITVTGATTTRIIGMSGNLTFGNVKVGSSANATMTIGNTGNAPLAVSGISYPAGFTGNWASGTIAAGGSQDVTVTFTPSAPQPYSGMISVSSDSTSGTNIIPAIGQGTQTAFEAWQADSFTAGEISGGSAAPATDFEHDGMANLLEYAFAKNPKVADLTGIAPNVSTNKMQISFRCDASCTDITYSVQASPNLSTWTDIAQSVGGAKTAEVSGSGCIISDTGTGVRTVTVTEAAAFTGKRFLRVKVTSP